MGSGMLGDADVSKEREHSRYMGQAVVIELCQSGQGRIVLGASQAYSKRPFLPGKRTIFI